MSTIRPCTTRLPNETLSWIFELVVREECEEGSYAQINVPAWTLSIPHVCKYWRALALGTPMLWTRISPHFSPGCYEAHCTRSKRANLRPVISLQQKLTRDQEDKVDALARRAEKLIVLLRPGPMNDEELNEDEYDDTQDPLYWLHVLNGMSSEMRSLSLIQHESQIPLDIPYADWYFHDELHHLTISCLHVTVPLWFMLENAFLCNLRSLEFHSTIETGQLRGICGCLGQLERLICVAPRVLKFATDRPFVRKETPLKMGYLRELTLGLAAQPNAQHFLAALDLPMLESFHIRFRASDASWVKNMSRLAADLTAVIRPLMTRLTHGEVLAHDEQEVALVLSRSPVDEPVVVVALDLEPEEDGRSKAHAHKLFTHLLSDLSVEEVRTLGLADVYTVANWRELLDYFSNVEEVWYMRPKYWHQVVADCEFLDALRPKHGPFRNQNAGKVLPLLPSLRRMTFTGRPTRFAGLRNDTAVTIFHDWTAHPNERHSFELLRLADSVGRLNGVMMEFVFEDVESLKSEVCAAALGRVCRREAVTEGSRIVARNLV